MGKRSKEKSSMLLKVSRVEIGAKHMEAEGSQHRNEDSDIVHF